MKKGNTRDVILHTASELFQRQGYHGTGLNQIIEKSGAPKGSLYYHFPNGKEEIAIEAIKLMGQHILESAREDLSEKDTAIEAFQHHVAKIADVFDGKACVDGLQIGLIASEMASSHESIRLVCKSAYEDWQALYTECLQRFDFETERAKELAVVINSLLEGASILAQTNESGWPLRAVAKQLPALLVH
ncbi:TetR/AcrR family transcriptional regulator [Priestia filamentosa]|jgi:TetR/AcrR family transcriptional regulator, lmrAB and yxaGH operons repressor|uniref:TetR family transcriptional regulator n=2 Tax=Priestia TaxID=2800373 RepID=A0A0H4KLE9_9BACI|nr:MULTISPECIES: TetR/AcrR family transcriptional regulator [Priestia]AKO93661.1 TetR family transcriptional regulator [Priestia filamentosa]KAB2494489.1 TetR/AcrR family transcriptional regulator [Priestia endophytica]MCM3539063.1 TetR/AcrR family transcriptional regulator [Priestia endophytica]MED3725841.1 TetR/AcrR family transcriptional regulator [Priestia filamentosa]RAS82245.1 TetR family transcriptional regulator [Priestia endophytica]